MNSNIATAFINCLQAEAGVQYIILHGCAKCDRYVYVPADKRDTCPHVNEDGQVCGEPRYDTCGEPKERVFYFPLTPKLNALMKCKKYRIMCQHEFFRDRNPLLMTDVYDGAKWKKYMRPCTYPVERIGLLGCGDGIPAFDNGQHSLKPWMFKNLSLPPGVRSKLKYFILWMLLDCSIKPQGQRKYFEWSTSFELKKLHYEGVDGMKVKIFSISMDTKGREEVSGMITCQGYQSCPVCTHALSPPLSHGLVADGFRSFLPMGDPGRQQSFMHEGERYEFKDVEVRPIPKNRNTELVWSVCAIATKRRPILGHKFPPVICSWPEFDWERLMTTPELMHDTKNCTENFVRLLVGKTSGDGYDGWGSRDGKHREQCKNLGIFREVWPENGGPLPWRLTKDQRLLMDRRMSRVLWPHYIDPLYYRGKSFWRKPGHMWKAARKFRILFSIMPTTLRDQVPKFEKALLLFAWSMKRLLGQTYSYDFAKTLRILPGSRAVSKGSIPVYGRDLRRALVLFEGCTPIDHLKPVFHRSVHYPQATEDFSLLDIIWMMGFERYNKHLKNHVRNPQCANINMANATAQTDTANYFELLEEDLYELDNEDYHRYMYTLRTT